jgi:hypothetical protein
LIGQNGGKFNRRLRDFALQGGRSCAFSSEVGTALREERIKIRIQSRAFRFALLV